MAPTVERGSWRGALLRALVTTCTMLFVFAAFRNSMTWYLDKVWNGSRSFWSYIWGQLYAASGESDFIMAVPINLTFGFLLFTFMNGLFIFVDNVGWPRWFYRYKIQETVNAPVSKAKYIKTVKLVAFNSLVTNLLFTVVVYPISKWRGTPFGYELPSFYRVIIDLAVFALCLEVGFYYSHRLLHHPKLYRYIHKVHHEWTAPVSIVSIYAHPLEHVMSNLIPIYLGPLLMGSHLFVQWLWLFIAIFNTTHTHSGFHLPFMPSSEAHDYHHSKFTNNFGALGILDRLHGTDLDFRRQINSKRHFTLTGMASAKELIPDPKMQMPKKQVFQFE